ncbi:MAG: long-chain fatty acid--CoA ligase [Phototrophicales bacterium]|nr:MAG: long-chain fatty acid--CoA ligase [Phototrophicales bacterium]
MITDYLQKRADLTPDRIALTCTITNRQITYQQWNAQANQTANLLISLGIRAGDRVAVYATNSVDYMDVWMACGKIGAVLQNLNWRLTVHELQFLIRDAAPLVLFYSADFNEQIEQLRPHIPSVRHFIAFDEPIIETDHAFSLRADQPTVLQTSPELEMDAPWVICYTGGTTGLPKGAILTHANMTWNSINTVMSWGLDQNDVAILNAPLFHTGGLNVFTLPLIHVGGRNIVCKSFDVAQVFDLIANGGATVLFGVPTMFTMMQQHPDWEKADFSKLKIVISGGAPCPMPIFERFWEKGVDFKTGYGLTEAGPNNFALPPEDVRRKPGAVGKPLFHVQVKIVDENGVECPPNQAGELLIRGPHVTPGYWNNSEATQKTIINGWLHTGDLAIRDEEGYYTIVGRLKDMIISGGENIYPAEVESVMHAHPAVSEAALIGVPDEKWGEVGLAVVVIKPGCTLHATELLDFMQQRLAKYKVPKSVVFVDELPKTGPGKIDKKRLIAQYS